MTLRNGKFYDDQNNEVRPQIGNAEQIALLKEAEAKPNEMECKVTYIEYKSEMSFSCESCNNLITDDSTYSDRGHIDMESICDDIADDYDHKDYRCSQCGAEYTISGGLPVKQ